MSNTAIVSEKLKEMLFWSDRLGSDEIDEIEQCLLILKEEDGSSKKSNMS